MARLHAPLLAPTDVIPHLARGERHWKQGYSAHAIATTWFGAKGLPDAIHRTLGTHPRLSGAVLLDAFVERETDLRDGARGPSCTDVLAILKGPDGLVVMAVEGKVREDFGPTVESWANDAGDGSKKGVRLASLRTRLGLSGSQADHLHLRYQLLHRTAAALLEADDYDAAASVMMVHSFDASGSHFDDFAAFAAALGAGVASRDQVIGPVMGLARPLYLGWTTDNLPPFDAAAPSPITPPGT
jgi:hypothetical protein